RSPAEGAYAPSTRPPIQAQALARLRHASGHLPVTVLPAGKDAPFQAANQEVIDEFERRYLEGILIRAEGNVTRAAADAGLVRQVLQRLLRRHGIDPRDYRR